MVEPGMDIEGIAAALAAAGLEDYKAGLEALLTTDFGGITVVQRSRLAHVSILMAARLSGA